MTETNLRIYPILDVRVWVIEEILLHLLGSLCLGGHGVRADTSAIIGLVMVIQHHFNSYLLVDQNAYTLLLRLNLLDHTDNALLVGDIALQWNNLAFNALSISLCNFVELFLCSSDDVHLDFW